ELELTRLSLFSTCETQHNPPCPRPSKQTQSGQYLLEIRLDSRIRDHALNQNSTASQRGFCQYHLLLKKWVLRNLRRAEFLTVSILSISSDQGESGGRTYKDAGVDIDAGTELVRRIAKMAPGIGGFGGLFPLGMSNAVAMSVSDIVTSGAKPLFFLDYFATSHLDVDLAEKVIKGIVDGCQQSHCTLLGGEVFSVTFFWRQ
ncbi:Phosphoribosylformylglycinamidine cyclo-ligase, chloroplastic/mitochondrial, partial [Sarracenia purpurea var. burkii]